MKNIKYQSKKENAIENKLISAFMTLYEELPIEKISVKKIVEIAKLNRGTFYLHYKDIYDLRERVISEYVAMSKLIAKNVSFALFSDEQVGSVLPDIDFYSKNIKYLKILLIGNGKSNLPQIMKEELKKNILLKYGFVNEIEEVRDMALEFFVTAQVAVILKWIQNDLHPNMDVVSSLIQDLTNNGFKKYLYEKKILRNEN